MPTQNTVRIKVPGQSFSSVLLIVSPDTTIKQIKEEVLSQLYDIPKNKKGVYYRNTPENSYFLKSADANPDLPTIFMEDWTIREVFENSVVEFELVNRDQTY